MGEEQRHCLYQPALLWSFLLFPWHLTTPSADLPTASEYTEESWANLQQALADAKAKAESPTATQEEIDAAKAAVDAAIKALTKPGETVSFTVTFNADNGSAVTTQTVCR